MENMTLETSVATVLLAWVSETALYEIPLELAQLLVYAMEEWKRAIAVRGPAQRPLQVRLIQRVVTLCGLEQGAKDDISSTIQAFLVSPLINITDIFCAIKDTDENVMNTVLRAHPFPVLERRLTAPIGNMITGAEVFLPLAAVAQQHPHHWRVFGLGPRRCPGKDPALCILRGYQVLARGSTWCPLAGHWDSGRHNDILSWSDSAYTLYTIGGLLWSWSKENIQGSLRSCILQSTCT